MIRYLIKNNFKLMMRSPVNLVLMIAGPLSVILVLASAFSTLLQKYDGVNDKFSIGYSIEASDSENERAYIEALKEIAAGEGITFLEFPEGEPKNTIENNDLSGFISFEGEKYTVYKSKDHPAEGKKVEYLVYAFMEEMSDAAAKPDSAVNKTDAPDSAVNKIDEQGAAVSKIDNIELTAEKHSFMKDIDSTDYYGIIEIVYFGWCAIICAAGIIGTEKKFRMNKRFTVSGLSTGKLYLAKLIPTALVVTVCLAITTTLTITMMGVHFGNIALTAMILVLTAFAATALGLMWYYITNNMVVTIVIVWMLVWFAGFFGGSFETYMYANHPQFLKELSPIYHINRSLVELSCEGKSDYIGSAVIYLISITIVCSLVSVLAGHIRRRGTA